MAQKRIPKKVFKKIEELTQQLAEKHIPVSEVYLFGSYAKGTQHTWSDIDVCIISPHFHNSWDALQYLWRIRPAIKDPYEPTIEPVGFTPKDFREGGTLINEIKRHGVKIV